MSPNLVRKMVLKNSIEQVFVAKLSETRQQMFMIMQVDTAEYIVNPRHPKEVLAQAQIERQWWSWDKDDFGSRKCLC